MYVIYKSVLISKYLGEFYKYLSVVNFQVNSNMIREYTFMITILLNLFKFVLWPIICSALVNVFVPWEQMYIRLLLGGGSINVGWQLVEGGVRFFISWLTFCVLSLMDYWEGCSEFPAVVEDLSIYLFSLLLFTSCMCKLLLSVRTHLGLLCLPGEPIIMYCLFLFPLIIFFAQKSALSDITVAIWASFWLVFLHDTYFSVLLLLIISASVTFPLGFVNGHLGSWDVFSWGLNLCLCVELEKMPYLL